MARSKSYSVTVTEIENKKDNIEQQSDKSSVRSCYDKILQTKKEDRQLFDFTSISECLDVAMHEYDLERSKKQSFDNRAGIIITVFVAIVIAIYDKIPVAEIFSSMSKPITFMLLIKIILACIVYLGLLLSFVFSVRVISVKQSENFDIKIVDSDFISSAKIQSVVKLLEIYLNLVLIHRENNENTARKLACSQWSMIISIISIIIYLVLL